MARVRELITQVAQTAATVLLLGESGTGKEVVARAIHDYSPRAKAPFIPINCGAIPGELLESELFGHEKGAFTGAVSARKGRFEMAEGGTLFLDEIGDMPFEMQVKLLRVLQERTYERVGGGRPLRCDVRVIAATHQNLEQKVAAGDFREDLFYRLNVFPIELPPLRARTDDIQELIGRFLQEFEALQGQTCRVMPDALKHLMHYHWPGNVRELGNLLERLTILHPGGDVHSRDLPERYQAPGLSLDLWADQAQASLLQSDTEPDPAGALQTQSDQNELAPNTAVHIAGQGTVKGTVQGAGEGVAENTGENPRKGARKSASESPLEDLSDLFAPVPLAPEPTAAADGLSAEALPIPTYLERPIDLKAYLADLECALITAALEQADWVNAQAAKWLNVQRTTLVEKIRKYQIERPADYFPGDGSSEN
jgi:sigma-54 specific flagellar transcriptional regulator A